MSSEKRLIIFTLVTFLSILAIQYGMEATGLVPPPPKKPAQPPAALAKAEADKAKAKDEGKGADAAKPAAVAEAGKADSKDKTPKAKESTVKLAEVAELTIGSAKKTDETGYRLELRLDQKGAGVAAVTSALYEAEFVENKPKHRPLELLKEDLHSPPSLALTIVRPLNEGLDAEAVAKAGIATSGSELPLDQEVWEVVRDDQGRAARPVTKEAGKVEGQEVVFRTKVDDLGLTLTKTFRLFKGEDGFETDLTFESPEKTQKVTYRLRGPRGIPIEGEWYTGTFRDAVFGMVEGSTTKVSTLSAYDLAKKKDNPDRFQKWPLRFTGIENQYFAALLEPVPTPKSLEESWTYETVPVVLFDDPESRQKSDITVDITSKPVEVGPNAPKTHTYRVFTGPKTVAALTPFGAEDLSTYRKNNWIPFAPDIARLIITPLLAVMYDLTRTVAGLFGGKSGNYGVAIILLTLSVRMVMFPLGRKQAMSAKKMQDLQPYMKEIQEKYKDDKETQTKETWALYKRHGVNPVGGCLPALIQMPIFVGLWQALNNSVQLRHASFLYIQNLAAPDMLFKFPTTVPFLGDYFNVLPFVVVALMLVQTKLFSPPATTPEQEAQQKMMKYMMVFMAFMFYKVPSGLGLYFITSSLWQISERLLLPKVTPKTPAAISGDSEDGKNPPGGGGGGGGRGGNGPMEPAPKPPGRFGQFWQKVLAEAQKNPTYRNLTDEKNGNRGPGAGPGAGAGRDSREGRDRDTGKPRAKPGRRR